MTADNEGDLPTDTGMEELVYSQMDGNLDEETNLQCVGTLCSKSYFEDEV
jgi:hypothetical protein